MDRIDEVMILDCCNRARQLHVVVPGRIGGRLRSFQLSELLIRIQSVKIVDRIARGIQLLLPVFQISYIVLGKDFPIGIIDKEKLHSDPIILQNTERLIGEIVNAAELRQVGSPHGQFQAQSLLLQT